LRSGNPLIASRVRNPAVKIFYLMISYSSESYLEMTYLMNFWRAGHSPLTRSFYESDLFPKMAKNWQMNRAATMRTEDGFLTLSISINCFTLISERFYRICFC
jgi:hypothetical protein